MLEFSEVVFSWPNTEAECPCIDELSFMINANESVALIGDNGAGKSTLFKLAAGLLQPSSGQVCIGGEDIRHWHAGQKAAHIGFLFQEPERQFFHSVVADEISYGMKIQGIAAKEREQRLFSVLEALHLTDHKNEHPLDLNAAQRRMVTIASLAVLDLPILLLDEPSRDFDDEWLMIFESWLAQTLAKGTTVLAISHDYDFVDRNFARVIELSAGKILHKK